jgi:hypothetical protein
MIRLPLLTTLLVAALTAATANSASAVTQQQCEGFATQCLGDCAGIDISTSKGNSAYGSCMNRCDRNRTWCMNEAAKTKNVGSAPAVDENPVTPAKAPGLPSLTVGQ